MAEADTTRSTSRSRPLGWPDVVTGALTVTLLASTFAPWARSGERVRSSYELVDVAGSAGIMSESIESLARAWYLVPIGCAMVFLCGVFTARRTAALALATVGASIAMFSYLVVRSPLIPADGCRVAFVLGTGSALWSVGLLLRPRRIGLR